MLKWFWIGFLVLLFFASFASAFSDAEFESYKNFCPHLFDAGLSMEQRDFLLAVSRNVVLDSFDLPAQSLPEIQKSFPENPGIVFVTFLVGQKLRASMGTAKKELAGAVAYAAQQALLDDRFKGKVSAQELDGLVIVIDILSNPIPTKNFEKDFVPGYHGVRVRSGDKTAIFKPSVVVTNGYSIESVKEKLCKKADLPENCFSLSTSQVDLYWADSFFENSEKKAQPVIAYSLPVLPNQLSKERLEIAARKIADYMVYNQSDQGDFLYGLFPRSGTSAAGYSVIREVASTWALGAFANQQSSVSYARAVKKALQFFLEEWLVEEPVSHAMIVMEGGDSKLGSNALLLTALQSLDDPTFETEKESLVDYILSQQRPNGSIDPYLFNKNPQSSIHNYYPGEALTAIAVEYQKNPRPELLEALQKGFEYYRLYWRTNKNTAFVPWHSRAYYHLYQFTKDPSVADFVFEMNDWLVQFQILDTAYCAHYGGYSAKQDVAVVLPSHGSSSVGAYTESFVHAFALADQLRDEVRRERYRKSVLAGFRYAIGLQFNSENDFWAGAGEKALGGIRTGINRSEIRIDNQQHVLLALVDTFRFFSPEDYHLTVSPQEIVFQKAFGGFEIENGFILVPSTGPFQSIRYPVNGFFCPFISNS
ncbi:AMMECR1 domain-containing protein [Candidatus Micrarchaeota archaeon]|nr:AMMECR1 domain-containing protein [Candidatus Micrarchaeota archaeon]MBU1930005.1 AMMECR1 domain-containing protein [Candidatus Micrarchaeota archaeon]